MIDSNTQCFLLKSLFVALWLVAIDRHFSLCPETNGTNEYIGFVPNVTST